MIHHFELSALNNISLNTLLFLPEYKADSDATPDFFRGLWKTSQLLDFINKNIHKPLLIHLNSKVLKLAVENSGFFSE